MGWPASHPKTAGWLLGHGVSPSLSLSVAFLFHTHTKSTLPLPPPKASDASFESIEGNGEAASFRPDFMIFGSNALCAFGLNLAVFLVVGKTSALTLNVAGVVKDWLLIGFSWSVIKGLQAAEAQKELRMPADEESGEPPHGQGVARPPPWVAAAPSHGAF
jgi:hypothetical protein